MRGWLRRRGHVGLHHLGVELNVFDVTRGGRALLDSLLELCHARDAPAADDGDSSSIRCRGRSAAELGSVLPKTPVPGDSAASEKSFLS
jgi:hypothetical protein